MIAVHAGAVAREVAAIVQERFGGNATFVADGGDALAWALAYFGAELPGRLLTTTTALGTLGVGMPFALAAQAARPDERGLPVHRGRLVRAQRHGGGHRGASPASR